MGGFCHSDTRLITTGRSSAGGFVLKQWLMRSLPSAFWRGAFPPWKSAPPI